MGSLGWKKFDFFDSSVVHGSAGRKGGGESKSVQHGWNSSEGERLCTVERLVADETNDGYFWVGSTTGMVYRMHVESRFEAHIEYGIDKAFPVLEEEGARVVYLEHIRPADTELLVAVGVHDGDPCMEFLCWEVENFAVVPKQVVSSRVFRSVKVPEGRITCVDVECGGWPHVYITIGTSLGGVYVYSCADVTKRGMAFQMPFGHHVIKGGHEVVDVHMIKKGRDEVYVYGVSGSGVVGIDVLTGRVLMEDDIQACPECSDVNQMGELVMCNTDGIFFYDIHDGRTVAASIKGEKEKMVCFGEYVLVCFSEESMVKMLHVQRKIVACSMQLDAPVRVLFRQNIDDRECLILMDGNEQMHRVLERSPESQIDALCNSRCFTQALRMCEGRGEALQAEANRRHGDYLFEKRDFDAATEAYIRTIGFLETSYPIQKLLNAQQIHNLCIYVRAVFDKKMASGDHISLLIQSYAKAKATLEIDSFVAELCAMHREYTFDTDAAIGVLRDNGLVQHALDIAQAYNKDEMYVSIVLNEREGFKDVLDYLRSKPREFAAKELAHHGKVLLQKEPVDTTALLMELCLPPEGDSIKDTFIADLASFSQLYIDNPQDLRYACEAILAMGNLDLPSKKSLYHNLFDIYLSSDRCDADMDVAMDLLKRGWVPGHEPEYDADVVLTSCRLHGFHKGLIFINLMLHRYREAIAVMAEIHDWRGIVQTCQKHGDASQGGDPMVWHDALVRMASPAAGPGGEETLKTLLELVEENAILPPLTVLNVLAKNPHLKLGLVKQYFSNLFESEYECIKEYEKEIEQIRKNIESQERLLHQLENEPTVFQATKDSQTGAPLELPLVHFMCGHSFNMRTLGDQDEPECPLCSEDHTRIQEMTKSFRAASQDKDSFFRQLRAADDGFHFVAEAFGKGYLNHCDESTNSM
ncbi:hypothetical protein M9434_001907 [Picochlorum sp. BPE23]|nr:hypothetical protein M9434_001907 [Picochlorum sp. BPE23]